MVIKNDDIKKYLTLPQRNQLLVLCAAIASGRHEDGKPMNNEYYVCNVDEPYADNIMLTIMEGEEIKKRIGTKEEDEPTPSEVTIEIKKEDVEDAIYGLQLLKPMVQAQVVKGNGNDTKQAEIDVEECGKHFVIAIVAMTMLLSGFEDGKNGE